MANKIQIKHGTTAPGSGKLSSFELGYATQTGKLYISTDGSNILNITPASHSHVWTEVTGKPAVLDYGIRGTSIQFTVDGNANTYYPVIVAPRLLSPDMIKLSVSRVYSEPAPDTWNTPTHKGGLTLTVFCTGYGTWSGNSSAYYVLEHAETYTTICSGIDIHVSSGLIFYLRGGGARYSVTGDCWLGASATVYLSGYTAPNGTVFPAMAYSQAKVDSSINAKKISSVSWSQVLGKPSTFAPSSHTHDYVPTTRTVNSKALSANISLTAADVGAAASSHAHSTYDRASSALTGANVFSNIVVADGITTSVVSRALTAANIGAAAASHTHSYAATSHTHSVANITDLTGGIIASGSGTNNWWHKLTDGTIVKYGYVSLSTAMTAINYVAQSAEFTVTFNTGAPFTVVPTVNISGRAGDYSSWPAIYSCTTTGFKARLMARAASGAQTWYLHYTAVGR